MCNAGRNAVMKNVVESAAQAGYDKKRSRCRLFPTSIELRSDVLTSDRASVSSLVRLSPTVTSSTALGKPLTHIGLCRHAV